MMRRAVWSVIVMAQLAVLWSAVAQTNRLADPNQSGPVIAISPRVLDFGLVGVGRAKDLTLTVQNVGTGVLSGAATVATPFSVFGNSYSLRSGQSKSLTVRYRPTAEGTNSQSLVFSGGSAATVPVMGSARTPPPPPGNFRPINKAGGRFAEEAAADFIVRYYSDEASFVLKPPTKERTFQSPCDRPQMLRLAQQQPRHDLAVVVLPNYVYSGTEETDKQAWVTDLKKLGYQRVVFLRNGGDSMGVKGLIILDDPQPSAAPSGR